LVATAAAAICIILAWNHRPPPVSGVSIKVLSYDHFSEPIPNDSPAGTGIPVEVSLINKGEATIRYAMPPSGWLLFQTATGWSRCHFGSASTEDFNLIRPGSNFTFAVVLPESTKYWKCSLSLRTATARERAAFKMMDLDLWRRFGTMCKHVLRLFPHQTASEREFESDLFEGPQHN